MNYHMAIDMWSLGCIMAELYTGFPIFPGENEQEQLSCIMEVLGVPDKDFINRSSRRRLFFGMLLLGILSSGTRLTCVRRPNWCSSSSCKLEGSQTATRVQDASAGAPLRRRALRGLHLEVPHLGPRASPQATGRPPPPVHHRRQALEADEPAAELVEDASQLGLIELHLQPEQQDGDRDPQEVADQRADAPHCPKQPRLFRQRRPDDSQQQLWQFAYDTRIVQVL